jgi:hypothetical protein
MASERLDLTPAVVERAIKFAIEGTDGIHDFCDIRQPYLVLRVRGHAASWLVKTRDASIKVGDPLPPRKQPCTPRSPRTLVSNLADDDRSPVD